MPKVWNLGNTTVRNPNRLQSGLVLLEKEFQGNLYGKEAESAYVERLKEEGIIDTQGTELDWFGRKWRSAFVKLGFITEKFPEKYKNEAKVINEQLKLRGTAYEVTPSGYALIGAGDSIGAIDDVFTRQLIQHELPSPIERSFPEGRMKPFIFLLQVLYRLSKKEEKGLNKFEIGAFLQRFRHHTDGEIEKTVKDILLYRKKRERIEGKVPKKRFDADVLKEAGQGTGIKYDSLKDYADTTVRYTKMSGLVTQQGARLVLRENKIMSIEAILSEEPRFCATENPLEYLEVFYKGADLPTDNKEFSVTEINRLKEAVNKAGKTIEAEIEGLTTESDAQELERARYKLIDSYNETKEEKFAEEQAKEDSVDEILQYLYALEQKRTNVELGIIDRPAYFEWAVWRAFLAIDHIIAPISSTRKFPLDEDLLPRHNAPGGSADMVFEFNNFVIVVEVTLTTSSRQEAAEGEPVRRHVFQVKEATEKDVIGVFIAPTIDTNTAHTFSRGVWYKDDKEQSVDIVPFTMMQFREIIALFKEKRYLPDHFKTLLDKCLKYRKSSAPEWKRAIRFEINNWIKALSQA
jgi:hypothetical protein